MSAGEILLWVILPYVAIATFLVGHWWRYRADQFGWTSGSTQLFEHKILGWAGPAFHYGALAAVGGHVIGLMIPKSFTEAIGMSESTYRWFSAIAGAVAGAVCVVGFVGLVYRRATNVRVRRTTSRTDLLVLPPARGADRAGLLDDVRLQPDHRSRPYDYRESMSVWWRSLFILQPDVEAVQDANARLPGPRDHRLGVLGGVPVQPARPRAGASRCSTSGARTSSTGAATRRATAAMSEDARATAASWRSRCSPSRSRFYGWALLGPLGPELQEDLGLSDVQLSIAVAVPVLLGSLMRIPMGVLTERFGGRRVFTLAAGLHDRAARRCSGSCTTPSAAIIVLGFLLGFAGASFAVGVPFVNRWYPPERQGAALGIYGAGMGGTVLAGLTAPRIADALERRRRVLRRRRR